ncbi:MAG TPA: TetR/AcrR family transcriptional regulator [Burkholderiaceae bacterium]|nr:TetR/AcrR family transcriptional regulator [Burkholderiaceae bacterium]
MSASAPLPLSDHRRRLLDAMAACVASKGYPETTIADIAAQARVSKRTFYEHFDGKADCLVALYRTASAHALDVLRQAIDPARPWQEQVEQAIGAYLAALAANPVLLRTLFIEILGLGEAGLRARREVMQDIAEFIARTVAGSSTGPVVALRPHLHQTAMGVVGAINELVLEAIEQDRVDRLAELTAPTARWVRLLFEAERPLE